MSKHTIEFTRYDNFVTFQSMAEGMWDNKRDDNETELMELYE